MQPLGLILLLLLVALPLLEIAILIKVGSMIGIWWTLAIVIVTFVMGLTVVRQQGRGVARRIVETAKSGQPPVVPMMEAMLLMLAGGCLIAPGLITDAIGLALLVPPVRQIAARWAVWSIVPLANSARRRSRGPRTRRPNSPSQTIEADFERLDEKTVQPPPPQDRNPKA
jgi:UPF0716 protein FxsA